LSTDELLIGIASGFIGGALVLLAQWIGQWGIDNILDWPFTCVVTGLKPNLSMPRPRWEARVQFFNRTSIQVHVRATPQDASGTAINGWNITDTWTGKPNVAWIAVGPKGWAEFRVDGPPDTNGSPPTTMRLDASFFTLTKMKRKAFPVEFSYEF
jgi:hypothetical protein